MTNFKLAVLTKRYRGMNDLVDGVFSRAATFTIIDIVEGKVKDFIVEENEALALKRALVCDFYIKIHRL